MGLKSLIRMLGVLIVCFIIFGIVKCSSDRQGVTTVKSSPSKKKVFDDFPINDVAGIKIIEKDQTVTLSKGKNTWEVAERENYPVDTKKVLDLIRSIWDLNIAQPVPLQKNQYGRVKLLSPQEEATGADEAATVVKLTGADEKDLGSIWLGKVHEASEGRPNPFGGGMMMNDVGRYVKRGDSNAVFIVGETFDAAAADPSEWLDTSFFEVSKIKQISRKTDKAEDNWSLSREELAGEFILDGAAEGEELDSSKVTSMKSAFSSPQFEDVFVGEEQQEPTGNVFTVTTFDGFTYTIAAGEKNDLNELPLTIKVSGDFPEKREEGEEESDEEKKQKDEAFAQELKEKKEKLACEKKLEGRIFKVRSFVVDSITKTRSEILVEKEEEEAAPEAPATGAAPTPPVPPAPAPTPAPAQPEAKPEPEAAAQPGKGKAKAEAPKAEAPKGKAKAKAKAKAEASPESE